jgi:predicted transposase YbfD/YdcC
VENNSTGGLSWTRPGEAALLDVGGLYSAFQSLYDARKARGKRYSAALVVLLVVLAKLCGEDLLFGIAEWVRARKDVLMRALGLSRAEFPCHNTYRRVLGSAVDAAQISTIQVEFLTRKPGAGQSVLISIDGKTLRGTIPAGQSRGVHLLAAYLPEEGIVLVQIAVDGKENEITAAPRLLQCLDLRGKVVTGDAMMTQRELSEQIVEAGGDYVWVVKDNQPRLRENIETLFEPERCVKGFSAGVKDFQSAETWGKEHGRFERRTICVSGALKGYLDWPYAEQVFRLERCFVRTKDGTVAQQVVYGITSLTPKEATPLQLLRITRGHWGIENGLHYRRDKTLREDLTRMTNTALAETIAILHNLVIGLILQASWQYLPAARRHYNAHPLEALDLILHPPV